MTAKKSDSISQESTNRGLKEEKLNRCLCHYYRALVPQLPESFSVPLERVYADNNRETLHSLVPRHQSRLILQFFQFFSKRDRFCHV